MRDARQSHTGYGELKGFAARLGAAAIVIVALGFATSVAAQSTMRQYRFSADTSNQGLALVEVPMPKAGPGEVLVRVRAVSLNRRDVSMLHGSYGRNSNIVGQVPLSDGAGEVVAIGAGTRRFSVGDRVAGTFFEKWIDGDGTSDGLASARGGSPGGMLTEYIVSHEDALVEIPDHLSFEEGATLPCAGVTAWVGLFNHAPLERDEFVLLEGTGGVSVFGLVFAKAAGARPIITSSSDEKLERARKLGAYGTANYRKNSDWQLEVREITQDTGVDHVLEVGGADTLTKALEAAAFGAHIALIGGLSGYAQDVPVRTLMALGATATGIYVGSRADFEAMNAFIARHEIHPVIDRIFEFEDAPAAFDFMESGSFFGKIVIRI